VFFAHVRICLCLLAMPQTVANLGRHSAIRKSSLSRAPEDSRRSPRTSAPPKKDRPHAAKTPAAPTYRLKSSDGFVAEPLMEHGDISLPGKPHFGEQFVADAPATGNKWQPLVTADTLPAEFRYTDSNSCALDAFNGSVGRVVLTRPALRDAGWQPGEPLFLNSRAVTTVIQKAGYQLRLARTADTPRKRALERPPALQRAFQQRSGSFVAEFHWRTQHDVSNYHCIGINCTTRKAICNTLGVVPFQLNKSHESAATHQAVKDQFHVYRMLAVWQVLRDATRVP